MDHLQLSPAEVTAVRRVLTIDEADFEMRVRAMLAAMHALIPSEVLGAGVGDRHGRLEFLVELPGPTYDADPQVCDGPLHIGLEHLVGSAAGRAELAWWAGAGFRDCLRLGIPLGSGRVSQIYFDRTGRYFEPRHVELLSMLQPALARLMRPPDRVTAMPDLSSAERRILDLVSLGASNRDVADQLSVSEATVRKHLEHTYRKLGVTNRTAAAALLRVAVAG